MKQMSPAVITLLSICSSLAGSALLEGCGGGGGGGSKSFAEYPDTAALAGAEIMQLAPLLTTTTHAGLTQFYFSCPETSCTIGGGLEINIVDSNNTSTSCSVFSYPLHPVSYPAKYYIDAVSTDPSNPCHTVVSSGRIYPTASNDPVLLFGAMDWGSGATSLCTAPMTTPVPETTSGNTFSTTINGGTSSTSNGSYILNQSTLSATWTANSSNSICTITSNIVPAAGSRMVLASGVAGELEYTSTNGMLSFRTSSGQVVASATDTSGAQLSSGILLGNNTSIVPYAAAVGLSVTDKMPVSLLYAIDTTSGTISLVYSGRLTSPGGGVFNPKIAACPSPVRADPRLYIGAIDLNTSITATQPEQNPASCVSLTQNNLNFVTITP